MKVNDELCKRCANKIYYLPYNRRGSYNITEKIDNRLYNVRIMFEINHDEIFDFIKPKKIEVVSITKKDIFLKVKSFEVVDYNKEANHKAITSNPKLITRLHNIDKTPMVIGVFEEVPKISYKDQLFELVIDNHQLVDRRLFI